MANYQKSDSIKVGILNNLGYEYWVVDPSLSVEFGNRALDLSNQINFKRGQAKANRVIGVADWALGNYDEALNKLFPSLSLYTEIGDSLGMANVIMNIGLVYGDQLSYEQALEYYYKGEAIFRSKNQNSRLATTHTKIGTTYTQLKQFDKAFEYLTSSLSMHKQSGFRYGISEASNRLGLLFKEKGDYENSLNYLNHSLKVSEEISDLEGKAKTLENIGSVYLLKKDYLKAEEYLLKAETAAMDVRSKKWLKDIYFSFKNLYQEQGESKMALEYFEKYSSMKDSLFDERKVMEIAAIRLKFEMDRQKKSIEIGKEKIRLLEQKSKNRSLWLALIGVLLVLGSVLTYLFVSRQRAKTIAERKRLNFELDRKNKELTSYTINFIRKNELIEDIKQELIDLEKGDSADASKIRRIKQKVNSNSNLDKDWQDFKTHFEEVHTGFFKNLKAKHSNLTSGELRLAALIRMNLNLKESAAILGISPESVKTSRYRLRKKLEIGSETDILEYIIQASSK